VLADSSGVLKSSIEVEKVGTGYGTYNTSLFEYYFNCKVLKFGYHNGPNNSEFVQAMD
jgi:hypothetical protein